MFGLIIVIVICNQSGLRSLEGHVIENPNSFNSLLTLAGYKKHNAKLRSLSVLLDKFSGEYGFLNKSKFNKDRVTRHKLESNKENISNSSSTEVTILPPYTTQAGKVVENRHVRQKEFEYPNYREEFLHIKPLKKNINQGIRKVPVCHSRGKIGGQIQFILTQPTRVELIGRPTNPITLPVKSTVTPILQTDLETTTERKQFTRQNISLIQLRKKIGDKSTVPSGIKNRIKNHRFGSKNYIITRAVSKKGYHMLPISLKNCKKQKQREHSYSLKNLKTDIQYTTPTLENLSTQCRITIETESILSTSEPTENMVFEAIKRLKYLAKLETTTNKIFQNEWEKLKPVLSTTDKIPVKEADDKSSPTKTEQRKLGTFNELSTWPIFSPYFALSAEDDKNALKVHENRFKVQELDKESMNVGKDSADYGMHDWFEDPFANGGTSDTEIEQ